MYFYFCPKVDFVADMELMGSDYALEIKMICYANLK